MWNTNSSAAMTTRSTRISRQRSLHPNALVLIHAVPGSEVDMRIPLEEYGLTVRTMNVMRANDLLTREDVVMMFPRRFYLLKGLGSKGEQELIMRLAITDLEKHPKRKQSRSVIIDEIMKLQKDIVLRAGIINNLAIALRDMELDEENELPLKGFR
jgi:hypothetical protein